MSKIALFGCKNTTLYMLNALRGQQIKIDYLITIDPDNAKKNEVADYYEFHENSLKNGITLYKAERYSLDCKHDIDMINSFKIDLGFVIGWQRLIPQDILQCITIGIFGMHGSAMDLPLGRGRSPMNWALIEGRHFFYTNLFRYNAEADAGEIIDQIKFEINDRDTSGTLHYKNMLAMKTLIVSNFEALIHNKILLLPQRNIQPSFYPKRTLADSIIDWNQDIFFIDRFIRAVTHPFNGAFSYINDEVKIIIYEAQIFDLYSYENFYRDQKIGEVLEIFTENDFLIKCIGGLLLVREYASEQPINVGMIFFSPQNLIKNFPINSRRGYDI